MGGATAGAAGNVAGNAGRPFGGAAGVANGGIGGFVIAGAAGRIKGGTGGGGRGGANCEKGCKADGSNLCDDDEVTWACDGNHEQDLFRENCEELSSSGRLRYCCPKSFLVECQ
jgi:hypothetical protein